MRLTRLSARQPVLWMREKRVEEEDVAVLEILTRLQSRYDAEDAMTAARVLYDMEDSDPQSEEEEEEADTQQHSYTHNPPPPAIPLTSPKLPRPPPDLLRGLLEISLSSLSPGTSREDTSADSKLAAWLGRVAQEQMTVGRTRDAVPQPSNGAIPGEQYHARCPLSSLSPLDMHESHANCSSIPPGAPTLNYPVTLLSGRPRPATQALPKRGRAFSAPATPYSDLSIYDRPSALVRPKQVRFDVSAGSDSSLNISIARTRDNSLAETSTKRSNASGYGHVSGISRGPSPPFIPLFDFDPTEPPFLETPWVHDLSAPADDKESLEDTWSPKTPLHTSNDDSLAKDGEDPARASPVTFHSVPLSSEFITAFESARGDEDFDRHVGALRDLSGIYATNLALQHISKSPMLVRNWQNVLDELTGRSRTGGPQIRPENELEMKFANNMEAPLQDFFDAHATALGLDGSTPVVSKFASPLPIKVGAAVVPCSGSVLASPEVTPDTSARKDTPAHSLIDDCSFPHHKTRADRALDLEFIQYLRLNITCKRAEVQLLKKLETQRLRMIDRLERVLSRKTLELMTSNHRQKGCI